MTQKVHIIGGGTVYHVRPHLALSAPAYGATARRLDTLFRYRCDDRDTVLHLTKMACNGGSDLETNEDIDRLLKGLVADPDTKMIVLSAALCDYVGSIMTLDVVDPHQIATQSGKDQPRLKSSEGAQLMTLVPAEKLIGQIRKARKDIFLIGFKTTAGATEDEQYLAGLKLLKTTSCNLVLANDTQTRTNMIVAPELARYCVTKDRKLVLQELVKMADARSRLTFTRTTIADGSLVPWGSVRVPDSLRMVVDWCVANGAYKPFRDVTVGHFAFREPNGFFVSSRRKQNYNKLSNRDMVEVTFDGDTMTAYGAKPSAGTTSQHAVLSKFPEFDCIVHFHCPARPGSKVTVRPQFGLECGSIQCGENTWKGMSKFGNLAAVMLDQHGPNIIFKRTCDPEEVIDFIRANFDFSVRTDGISVGS
jgi:hypothetical protein